MASAIYGVNVGQTEVDVTYSATTLATDIKLTVDLTKFATNLAGAKADILKAIEYLENYIIKDEDHIFG